MVSAEDYERILNWLYDVEQSEPDLQLKATCAPHYFRVMRQRRAEENRSGVKRDLPASHHRQVHGGLTRTGKCTPRPKAVWPGRACVSSRIAGRCSRAATCRSRPGTSANRILATSGKTARSLPRCAIPIG